MEESNYETLKKNKTKRTGKEITLKGDVLGNDKINCKIGASFEKSCPKTIYIQMSFWLDIKDREDFDSVRNYDYVISRVLSKELNKIYKFDLRELLGNNEVFPYYFENIYVFDFPSNINYNEKKSFVSIELNLHTLNCLDDNEIDYPLNEKNDTKIFDEAVVVCKKIAQSDLLQGNLDFSVHKRKSDK